MGNEDDKKKKYKDKDKKDIDKKLHKKGASDMFEKQKTKEELEKEKARAKMQKKAERYKKEQDEIRRKAERILDKDFVERRLAFERRHDEKKMALRDARVQGLQDEILAGEKETFPCKICDLEIGLGNMQCPHCGQMYCPFCGNILEDKNFTGKCPRCGGFAAGGITPAKLVQTRVEDIPEEDRFWEGLSECPKCGGSIQPDWDDCPLCGAKLETKKVVEGPKEEKSIASIKEKRKQELLKRRRMQKETGPKRGI
jgi:rubrerythrin